MTLSQSLEAATLETLPITVAVIDLEGEIRLTNRAWREFGPGEPTDDVGVDYLAAAAAEHASREGLDRTDADVVCEVAGFARERIRRETVSSLTRDQLAMLEALVDVGPARMGEAYEAYCERAGDPFVRRTVRKHLGKLAEYDLVRVDGERRARTYRAVDGLGELLEERG